MLSWLNQQMHKPLKEVTPSCFRRSVMIFLSVPVLIFVFLYTIPRDVWDLLVLWWEEWVVGIW